MDVKTAMRKYRAERWLRIRWEFEVLALRQAIEEKIPSVRLRDRVLGRVDALLARRLRK